MVAAYLSLFSPDTLTGRAHLAGPNGFTSVGEEFNVPEFWETEFPSGGGIASARGLAGMYDLLARGGERDGIRVVSAESIGAHTTEQVSGPDKVLLFDTRFGLGYQLPTSFLYLGPGPAAFGHGGLGGSLGFADPEHRVAAGYVMNQLRYVNPGETTRVAALVEALYSCL